MKKDEFLTVTKGWTGHPYQRWQRIGRLNWFEKHHLSLFRGRKVLEYGCNAGLYGYVISKAAESYIGLERDPLPFGQSKNTIEHFKLPAAKRAILNTTVEKFAKSGIQKMEESGLTFNTLFASYLLYHLNDTDLDLTEQVIIPKCDLIVIQNRVSKTKRPTRNRFTLRKPKHVEKWLNSIGWKLTMTLEPDWSMKMWAGYATRISEEVVIADKG
jgi:hypothetical protein